MELRSSPPLRTSIAEVSSLQAIGYSYQLKGRTGMHHRTVVMSLALLAALCVGPCMVALSQANQNPEYKKLQKRFKPAELTAIAKQLAAATRDGESEARKLYPDNPSATPSLQAKNHAMRDKMTPKLIEKKKAP